MENEGSVGVKGRQRDIREKQRTVQKSGRRGSNGTRRQGNQRGGSSPHQQGFSSGKRTLLRTLRADDGTRGGTATTTSSLTKSRIKGWTATQTSCKDEEAAPSKRTPG